MKPNFKRKFWISTLAIPAVAAAWFIVVRIISPWQVVKAFELETVENEKTGANSSPLRVACYNIAHGRGGKLGSTNWEGGDRATKLERLKQIAELLRNAELDIVVLNEVDFSSFWSGHMDQAKVIAQEAGYRYIVEQRNIDAAIPFVSLRFGNAILSKLPLSNPIFLDYPHPSRLEEILFGGFKDGVAATATLPDGQQVQIVAVHLSLEGETYRQESVRLFMDLHTQSSLPMIAMGDFNSTAKGCPGYAVDPSGLNCIETLLDSSPWSTLFDRQSIHSDTFTFPSEKPDRVIDWIFVTSPWHIREKRILTTELSDHLPVTATVRPQPLSDVHGLSD